MDDLIILDADYQSLISNTKKKKKKYNPITSKLTDGY